MSANQETAYAIFNYLGITWSTNTVKSRNIFIGYTDGDKRDITNQYSNNADVNGSPNLVGSQPGNTSKLFTINRKPK